MPDPAISPTLVTHATPRRRACPRCGARLGALSDAESYCGCCGLVLPAAIPSAPPPHAG